MTHAGYHGLCGAQMQVFSLHTLLQQASLGSTEAWLSKQQEGDCDQSCIAP